MSPKPLAHPAGDRAALLIIDMINDLEFDGAEAILDQVKPPAWSSAIFVRPPVAAARLSSTSMTTSTDGLKIDGRSSSGPVARARAERRSRDAGRPTTTTSSS